MRCAARVVIATRRRKGSGEPYEFTKLIATKNYQGILPPIRDDTEECGGTITAKVKAVEEPDWGGSHAEFNVEFKCERCGCNYFYNLPSTGHGAEERISEMLTKYIAALPQEGA